MRVRVANVFHGAARSPTLNVGHGCRSFEGKGGLGLSRKCPWGCLAHPVCVCGWSSGRHGLLRTAGTEAAAHAIPMRNRVCVHVCTKRQRLGVPVPDEVQASTRPQPGCASAGIHQAVPVHPAHNGRPSERARAHTHTHTHTHTRARALLTRTGECTHHTPGSKQWAAMIAAAVHARHVYAVRVDTESAPQCEVRGGRLGAGPKSQPSIHSRRRVRRGNARPRTHRR